MKKVAAILLGMSLLFVFAGCQNKTEELSSQEMEAQVTSDTSASSESRQTVPFESSSSKPAVSSKPVATSKPSVASKPAAISKPAVVSNLDTIVVPKPSGDTSSNTNGILSGIITSSPASSSEKPASNLSQTPSSGKSLRERIVGKWSMKMDLAPDFAEIGLPVEGPCNINYYIEFRSDGTLVEGFDPQEYREMAYQLYIEVFNNYLEQGIITTEDLEGMTVEEYSAVLADEIIDELGDEMRVSCPYRIENEKLFLQGSEDGSFVEVEYSFSNNDKTLTLSGDGSITVNRVE